MYKLQINNIHLENTTNKLNTPVTIIGYRDIDNMNELYDFLNNNTGEYVLEIHLNLDSTIFLEINLDKENEIRLCTDSPIV